LLRAALFATPYAHVNGSQLAAPIKACSMGDAKAWWTVNNPSIVVDASTGAPGSVLYQDGTRVRLLDPSGAVDGDVVVWDASESVPVWGQQGLPVLQSARSIDTFTFTPAAPYPTTKGIPGLSVTVSNGARVGEDVIAEMSVYECSLSVLELAS